MLGGGWVLPVLGVWIEITVQRQIFESAFFGIGIEPQKLSGTAPNF